MDRANLARLIPSIRNAIEAGKIDFSDDVLDSYEPFKAFRVVSRNKDDWNCEITGTDFLSYVELGKACNLNERSSYSCSLFLDKEVMENKLHFPRKNKRIIGDVRQENGMVERAREGAHIDWYLYDGARPQADFEYYEKEEINC